jgi:hypothetical protein
MLRSPLGLKSGTMRTHVLLWERVAPQIQAAQGPLRDADTVEPPHMTDPEKSKKGMSSVSTTTVRGMLTSRHRQAEGCSEEARR